MPNKSKYRRGRRRRMEKFNLGEVSFVDRPAQTPAQSDIQKAEEDDAQKRGDLVDFVSSSESGHQHGISIWVDHDGEVYLTVHFAAGEDGEMHDHQLVKGADGSYSMTENRGHTHEIDAEMLKQMIFDRVMNKGETPEDPGEGGAADLSTTEKAGSDTVVEPQETDDMTDLEKAQKELEALKAQNETLAKVAALSAAHKAHYDSMDAELEDDARKAFLEMDEAARDEAVAKAAEAAAAKAADTDPVIFTSVDGDEYRKSDDPRLVKMAKERDADRKESIRLRKKAEDDDLTKRATDELANLPGELKVRKAILKAVDGIEDEEVRTEAVAALKAHNARLSGALEEVGTAAVPNIEKSEDQTGAEDELDTLAKKMAKDEGIDFYDAYEKVSEANPQLLAKAVG